MQGSWTNLVCHAKHIIHTNDLIINNEHSKRSVMFVTMQRYLDTILVHPFTMEPIHA